MNVYIYIYIFITREINQYPRYSNMYVFLMNSLLLRTHSHPLSENISHRRQRRLIVNPIAQWWGDSNYHQSAADTLCSLRNGGGKSVVIAIIIGIVVYIIIIIVLIGKWFFAYIKAMTVFVVG